MPTSSSRRTISSHARSAPAGSGSTSASEGQVASASPRRMPGLTPAASAAAVTGPINGSSPSTGARAAGLSASAGRARSAARSSNPGMTMQAIMGTYVLHEHTFACQGRFSDSRGGADSGSCGDQVDELLEGVETDDLGGVRDEVGQCVDVVERGRAGARVDEVLNAPEVHP